MRNTKSQIQIKVKKQLLSQALPSFRAEVTTEPQISKAFTLLKEQEQKQVPVTNLKNTSFSAKQNDQRPLINSSHPLRTYNKCSWQPRFQHLKSNAEVSDSDQLLRMKLLTSRLSLDSLAARSHLENMQIKQVIRNKVSSYLNCKLERRPSYFQKKLKQPAKKITHLPFPHIKAIEMWQKWRRSCTTFIRKKLIAESMDFPTVTLSYIVYIKLVCMSIDAECEICSTVINRNCTILIQMLSFVAESFLQIGMVKISFYFASIGISLCEYYKQFYKMGRLLLILAKHIDCPAQKALEYIWVNRKHSQSYDNQLQVYNEFSYNLMQTNRKEQSRIFAAKYQTGYLQRQNSKIISLSQQLVQSQQSKISAWNKVKLKSIDLLFSVSVHSLVECYETVLKKCQDEKTLLRLFDLNYESYAESFPKKEMFLNEIPLPLESQHHQHSSIKRKIINESKFIVRNRSISSLSIAMKVKHEKVLENIILNYRSVGHSRNKLLHLFNELIHFLKPKIKRWKSQPSSQQSSL